MIKEVLVELGLIGFVLFGYWAADKPKYEKLLIAISIPPFICITIFVLCVVHKIQKENMTLKNKMRQQASISLLIAGSKRFISQVRGEAGCRMYCDLCDFNFEQSLK